MFLVPSGYASLSELERLSERSYSFVLSRLRKAGLTPIIFPRKPTPGNPAGGRPMHLYPLKEAIELILD